ncbi:hypothetical protein [Calothrix rhizosoleniae]|uniref:hypothetical protein n=1 Tax=Calothrix rhizosoleniae TaxID=888997 RepID=UPI000B49B20F|nr:hypothetical protein [Calothrix rhizosoleniae]
MEELEKEFWEIIQTVADEVDQFFMGISEMVDTFFDFTEEVTEQLQESIATEIEDYFSEITEPFLDTYWDMEDVVSDIDSAFPYPVEATPDKNPACMGCIHYHGHAYGGNLLVCGMHPHGWDDENCPDRE